MHKNVIRVKLFLRSIILKVPGGLKSQPTQTDWPFSILLFSSVDLEMDVQVRLPEVSASGRLKMSSISSETPGTAVWCPLTGGVR